MIINTEQVVYQIWGLPNTLVHDKIPRGFLKFKNKEKDKNI